MGGKNLRFCYRCNNLTFYPRLMEQISQIFLVISNNRVKTHDASEIMQNVLQTTVHIVSIFKEFAGA